MTYDLRRLRLHGLIEGMEGTHRYRPMNYGVRVAMFYTRVHTRILRPGLTHAVSQVDQTPTTALRRAFDAAVL